MSRLSRFTTLPLALYRIQPRLPVKLRDHATQRTLGRSSYDLKLHEGLVLPMEGDHFSGPNGMSLRPSGPMMHTVLRNFKGSPLVYLLDEGLELPEGLVCLHEHSDHYSMQVSRPMPFDDFNEKLTALLQAAPSQTREEFLRILDEADEDDQDN